MSLEVIYVTRHGFRSAWAVDPSTGIYTTSIRPPTGLPTDPALTSHGVGQANELAEHLLSVDPPIEQVYSSPYYRCMQTIQPFVRDLRRRRSQSLQNVSVDPLPMIRVDPGLSEWYGLAHFEHPSSAPLNELQNFFPEVDANYRSGPAPPRRGESLPELHERVARVIDSIIRRSDQEGHRAVLVCTHAAVVIALGRVLTGQMERDFGAFTCGLSKYRRRGSSGVGDYIRSDPKKGTNATELPARGKGQIGEARSETHPKIDHAEDVDPNPQDSPWPDQESAGSTGTGLRGSWICELDSDCSFLRGGEERGWKFSGDESFIETDDSGEWRPSTTISDANTAEQRGGTDSRDRHTDTVTGASKL